MGRHHRRTGRHRAPSTAGRAAARIVISAGVATAPLVSAEEVLASPPGVADAVVACESGGDFTAQNSHSTASGGFQFIDGTWRAFGGTEFAPRAKHASPSQQRTVFERAYAANGLRDWEASRPCWQGKIGRHAPGREAPKHAASSRPRHRATTTAPTSYVVAVDPPPHSYVVKPGDTLTKIAAARHTTWRKIYEANRDIVDNPDRIFPDERLRV
jgi:resuscitation-promoting factor RpfA